MKNSFLSKGNIQHIKGIRIMFMQMIFLNPKKSKKMATKIIPKMYSMLATEFVNAKKNSSKTFACP